VVDPGEGEGETPKCGGGKVPNESRSGETLGGRGVQGGRTKNVLCFQKGKMTSKRISGGNLLKGKKTPGSWRGEVLRVSAPTLY